MFCPFLLSLLVGCKVGVEIWVADMLLQMKYSMGHMIFTLVDRLLPRRCRIGVTVIQVHGLRPIHISTACIEEVDLNDIY